MPDSARASTCHDLATDGTVTDGRAADAPAGPPYADCVHCGEPTEYPAARPGALLCPVCEWQEAQRSACSG
ncbi:hypothetical protein [Streptomyces gilvosporeus]|uniref:Uncharacterized protein n=1 Tax=Streptomyces gilvosporeus TaxID=553510 RepID=A0A1V0TYE5_9ACTN|nr:hypothetical protein [Streptomyces gilvosporeus]ARF57964.1 hypothetical protein B1H19_30595 [Streptomyces gilvosporeus]